MEKPPFAIVEVLKEGWKLTKENLGFLICYQIILFALSFLHPSGEYLRFWYLHLLIFIVYLIADLGLYKSALLITSKIKPGFNQLYVNWKEGLIFLMATILFSIMCVIGILLFIVPGLYLIATYCFFPFFILDKGAGTFKSLELSAKATKGLRGRIFLFLLACFGLNLLGFLLLGVGLLFTSSITIVASAIVYRRLTQDKALSTKNIEQLS